MSARLLRLIAGSFVGILLVGAAVAQSPSANVVRDSTVRELLGEVRLLRRILQTTSLGSVQAQVLVAQQQHVAQLQRQVADARSAAGEAQAQADQLQAAARELESSLVLEADAGKRADGQAQIREINSTQQQLRQRAERQRAIEEDLTAALSREQARLEGMQQALEHLQRELEELDQSVAPGPAPR